MRVFLLALYFMILLSACSAVPTEMGKGSPTDQAALVRSSPADGSTVRAPVDELELQFARPARLYEVTVTDAQGMITPIMITATGELTRYSIPLDGLYASSYTVNWRARMVSAEIAGSIHFVAK